MAAGAHKSERGAMDITERRQHLRRYRVDGPDGSRQVICAIDAPTARALAGFAAGETITITDLDVLEDWQRDGLRRARLANSAA